MRSSPRTRPTRSRCAGWDWARRSSAGPVVVLLLAVAALAAPRAFAQAPAGAAAAAIAEETDTCLSCHADPELKLDLASGESVPLTVSPDHVAKSVHGGKLRCTDCHKGMDELPHPERKYKDAAEFRAGFRDTCKSCHFDNYRAYLDGVHHALAARGDTSAPGCIDCHGSHEVTRPATPRTAISETCANCHSDVYDTYLKSAHGRSLEANGNADVPVCTDCHRAHDIASPHTEAWLLRTPEMCGRCHTDAERMKKYGLSTNVLETYLADFHGMNASLRKGGPEGGGRLTALCIDCHGVHDIAKVDDPGSPVLKANLAKTCRRCHEGASDDFPAAWMSHYEPTLERAPLVWGVKVGYMVLIPFMIAGLVLQIVLHLWRVVVNR